MNAKEVSCSCGFKMTLSTPKLRCEQCGKYIFYDEKEKSRHRTSVVYTAILFVSALGLIAYLFVEMVAVPFFPR